MFPKWMVYTGKPYELKCMIWGVPLFLETPIYIYILYFCKYTVLFYIYIYTYLLYEYVSEGVKNERKS